MKFFFAFLGLALGVVGGYCKALGPLLVAAVLWLLLLYLSHKQKVTWIYLGAFLVGILLGALSFPYSEGKKTITGIVFKTSDNSFLLWRPFLRVYVYEFNHSRQVGDVLTLEGSLRQYQATQYESRFDYGNYLHYLGVDYQVNFPSIQENFAFPLRIRQIEKAFLSHFNNSGQAILDSLLFARKDYGKDVISKLSGLNVLYFVSASGMLLDRLLGLVRKNLYRFFGKERRCDLLTAWISILALPLSMRKIGILRVILLRWIRYFNRYRLDSKLTPSEGLGIAGILILLLDRYAVFQSGFLLGFGVSITLLLFGHLKERMESKLARKLFSLALIRFFLLPVSMSNGVFHPLSVLLGLLVAPYSYFLALLGLISFLTFPFPSLLNPLADGFSRYLDFLSVFDISLSLPGWDFFWIAAYYACYFFFLFYWEVGFTYAHNVIALTFFGMYFVSLFPIHQSFSSQVSFINVGQGDAILIRDHGVTVLLDTGGNTGFNLAEEVLVPYLRKQRIYKIDCLIASHHDADHIGEKDHLTSIFPVRRFVDSKEEFPLSIGNLTFENLNDYEGEEENDLSLVLKLDFMGQKWMFMGDAPISIENRIMERGMDVDIDILKVGHHGSKTSTSQAWINATSPMEAVVSVGKKNSYGHPDDEVIARLLGSGVKIRRTDEEGTITYSSFSWSSL